MNKIQYNIYDHCLNTASSKAKNDVSIILNKFGFNNLYNPSKYRLYRIIQQFLSLACLKKDTIIFIQYHSNIAFFYRLLAYMRKVKKVAIIHDLESLRHIISVDEEISLLNGFDVVISHNPNMTRFLKENGFKKLVFDLDIFDYLLDDSIRVNNSYSKDTVFFAGNLVKSHFLYSLENVGSIKFNLYGPAFDGIDTVVKQSNVSYWGSFTPTDLISHIEGGWGLVWDGDSIDTCSGIVGEYLKYNNPHKVSMCIVSERPVIIWSQSAMADYIVNKKIGIVVDSLKDIQSAIQAISDDEYLEIVENVRKEKAELTKGKKLEAILKRVDKVI